MTCPVPGEAVHAGNAVTPSGGDLAESLEVAQDPLFSVSKSNSVSRWS